MKLLISIVALGAAGLLSACESDKANSESGQPDYLQRVGELTEKLNKAGEAATCGRAGQAPCDGSELKSSFDELADEWNDLDAPAVIAREHAALGRVLDEVAHVAGIPTEEIVEAVQADPDIVEIAQRSLKAEQDYDDAISDYFGVMMFSVEGAAMEPAFSDGDVVFVEPTDTIDRWDIILFEFPLDVERTFIKRVVGLPGETVEVRDGNVLINGDPIDDPYQLAPANYTYGPRIVPTDAFFVLGDNRRNSFDSHAWGNGCAPDDGCDFVSIDLVLGELPPDTRGDDLGD